MHRILLVIIFILYAFTCSAQELQRIAAVVNDEIISIYDLEARIRLTLLTAGLPDNPDTRRRVGGQVLRKLIDEKLQLQEANKFGINVHEAEIASAISNIEKQNKMPPGEFFKILNRAAIDAETINNQMRAEISWIKLVRKVLSPQARISEEEIKAEVNILKSQHGKPEYLLAEIFLPVENNSNEEEIVRLADRLTEQLRQGTPFPALARQFSQNATAANGGDIGWIAQGLLPEEFEREIIKLNSGEITSPIRSLTGYHIFTLRDKRVVSVEGMENPTVSFVQMLLPDSTKNYNKDEQRNKQIIDNITSNSKNCQDVQQHSSGIKSSTRFDNININSLPDNFRKAISSTQNNKITQPIKSKEGTVILMVCSRSAPEGQENINNTIKERLERERLDLLARRHLRDIRRAAFVDIRI